MTKSRYYKKSSPISEIWCINQSELMEAYSKPLHGGVRVGQPGFNEAFNERKEEIVGTFFPLYEILHENPMETNGLGGFSQKQIQSLRNMKKNQCTYVMGVPQNYKQWTNHQILELVKTKAPSLGLVYLPTMYNKNNKQKKCPEWMDQKCDVFNCGYMSILKIESQKGDFSKVLYNVYSETLQGKESLYACLDKHLDKMTHHFHLTIMVYQEPAFSLVTEA